MAAAAQAPMQPSYNAPPLSETVDALAHSAFAHTHHAPPEELFSGPGLSTGRRPGRPPMAPSANSAAVGSGGSPGAKKAAGASLGAAVPAAVLPAPRKVHHADDEWDCIQAQGSRDDSIDVRQLNEHLGELGAMRSGSLGRFQSSGPTHLEFPLFY